MPFNPKLIWTDACNERDESDLADDDVLENDGDCPNPVATKMNLFFEDDLLADLPPELQAFASQLSDEADDLQAAFPATPMPKSVVAQAAQALPSAVGSVAAGHATSGRGQWLRRAAQVAAMIAVLVGLSLLPLRRDDRVAKDDRGGAFQHGRKDGLASQPTATKPTPQAKQALTSAETTNGSTIEPAGLSPSEMPATTFVELSGAEQEAMLDLLSETASMGSI